jgi:hypothetical protein
MAYKTKYYPKNPSKYIGDHNNIICRSLWERKFCKYLDENKSVLRWASEEITIPYLCPVKNKVCLYYPDFLFETIDDEQNVKTYLVEIKPKKQTTPPTNTKKKSYSQEMMIYMINKSKWKSADKLCEENGWTFKILTEDELHIK